MEEKEDDMGAKVHCLECDDIIESKFRHNFVWCKCGLIGVDGGDEYLRITASSDKDYAVIVVNKKEKD